VKHAKRGGKEGGEREGKGVRASEACVFVCAQAPSLWFFEIILCVCVCVCVCVCADTDTGGSVTTTSLCAP
jgi:hypothetical protein